MDPANYYYTTLMTAFTKLAPYFIFIVGGYFVFIKLPFLFLKKSMDEQKKTLEAEKKETVLKIERPVEKPKEKVRIERKEDIKKEGPKKEAPKRPAPSSSARIPSPEEILGFKPGETFTQSELKKRYFELLKQNHPDRVATMGADFKKLADKNTKDITQAYEKLKTKAA